MKKACVVLLVSLVLTVASSAFAATYYVATNGDDGWPGTQAQPWRTIQHAVDTIAPGDTIIVKPGAYAGCRIELSGTSGAPKTLMAETVGAVTLNALGPTARHNGILEVENYDAAVSYWVIDGFVIDGINKTYRCYDSRSTYDKMNSNITARNLTVYGAYMTGIFSAFTNYALIENCTSYSNGEHGIYVNNSCDNGIVRGNVMYSNTSLGCHMNGDLSMGGDGIMSGWLLEKNMSFNNGSNGFDADGVETTTWKNNLVYDNASKSIHLTCADGGCNPRYDSILNNTCVNKAGSYYVINFFKGKGSAGKRPGGNNNTVKNNILYHYETANQMRGSIMGITSWMPTLQSDYNVVVDRFAVDDNKTRYTLAQWRATWSKDLNSTLCLDVNALFVDPANKNFHLKSTSPAVNAGTTLAGVTDDLEGTSRPQGTAYDCGCYEDW